jgi:hypothetical protein
MLVATWHEMSGTLFTYKDFVTWRSDYNIHSLIHILSPYKNSLRLHSQTKLYRKHVNLDSHGKGGCDFRHSPLSVVTALIVLWTSHSFTPTVFPR